MLTDEVRLQYREAKIKRQLQIIDDIKKFQRVIEDVKKIGVNEDIAKVIISRYVKLVDDLKLELGEELID